MSLNRVSSLESFAHFTFEGQRRSPSPSSRDRRLSFNPLPESWDPPTSKPGYLESVGAFEVPKWKRVLQVFATVIYCLFAAGIVFGYAALKPVLKKEGAYQDVCGADDSSASLDDVDTCVEIRLNLMFTVAAVSTNVAALPIGTILDHFGPRVCGLFGSLFLTAGALLMAFERSLPFDGLLFGYLFLALGGPFTYISSFQLSNAFPKHSGLILALLTGAFDASSALFLVYRIIFEKTGGSFGHDKFFLAYLVVPVIIALLQFVLLPKHSYKTIGEMIEQVDEPLPQREDQMDENTALLEQERREHRENIAADLEDLLGSVRADKQQQKEEKKNDISGVWGVMHAYTAWQQIRSPWFILICLFTVIQMTRINYFVATIRPQYEALLHSHDRAVQINNFFDLALPIGGILSIPFIGLLLDHFSTVVVLFWLVAVTTAIGVFGIIPEMWAAYTNIILFVLYRPFYYTAVSDYSAKVFGFKTFGTVYGTIICLSGLFNFSQSGLDYLLHSTFEGDPIPVNLMLLSLGLVVGVSMVVYVGYQVRGLKRKMLEMEAERAVGTYN
ncbi:major facilitator superfamily transporter [Diaporthe amygdali]|uniref:major facilitator superfamily transporter n=1 Tax=Phomopsis amygdali TaxID=1214568 RepID=UPI0022FE33DA|nr:major facilitator superfamily transporter [Diaporthe amygdali]KAJ0121676.1 major facilitator superfamily transporter [Diaporthe amygdali]